MSEIAKRLDKVRSFIQSEDFLESKGLSNEVNIWFFCYDPGNEMAVRSFVRQLTVDQSLRCRLIVHDLYQIFLSICEDMDILEAIPDMEAEDGSAFLLEQLGSAIGARAFVDKMQMEERNGNEVLMLTGAGEVNPFVRIHTLLDTMQPYFPDIPIIVMYPGDFDGRRVSLFKKLKYNDYYRAFNLL